MHTPRRSLSISAALITLVTLHLASSHSLVRPADTGIMFTPTGREAARGLGAAPIADLDARAADPDLMEQHQRPVWRTDEVLVSAVDGQSLASIAADHGLRLRRGPGLSGYAPLLLSPGQDVPGVLGALRQDPRVATADRAGFIYGAGASSARSSGEPSGVSYEDYQWHLDRIGARELDCGDCDPSAFTVAVLDTGVAYENYTDEDGRAYAIAASLEDVSFVAPKDLVEGDDHPNDDHQHGTHIASLIASSGLVMGVAPGVQIMPVKVLNADNVGSEADLVEAIVHAVDNGADIINMSLCFSEGYAPSAALRDALQHAHDAGVLMVAAAGNEGVQAALYPAASPLVISVGASQIADDGELTLADYSNTSPTLDILAPGGNLDDDMDGDGYVDGILAETINPDDPTDLGLWFYAGTSQAAALTSGSLVWLLAAGETDVERMTRALAAGSEAHGGFPYYGGQGAGDLQVQGAVDVAAEGGDALDAEMAWHVALVPYIKRVSSKKIQPMLRLTVVDEDGEAAKDVHVVGSWWGSDGSGVYKCKTDSDGVCTVSGTSRKASTSDALAWGASVDAAFSKKAKNKGWLTTDRPNGVVFVSDGLVLLSEALDAEGMLLDTPIGLKWSEATDEDGDLGKVAAGYTVVNAVTGGALRPEAVLLTPGLIEPIATLTELDLDFGDVEDASDASIVLLDVAAGSGIVSDSLGLLPLRIVFIEGLGIVSDSLGIRSGAVAFYSRGTGIVSDSLGFKSSPLQLQTGTLVGLSLDGYALDTLVESGGWLDEDDYPGATVIMSSGAAGMAYDPPTLATGALGATRVE